MHWMLFTTPFTTTYLQESTPATASYEFTSLVSHLAGLAGRGNSHENEFVDMPDGRLEMMFSTTRTETSVAYIE